MDWIVLDLEWDSAYSRLHKRFINQILQIGAVRLDEHLEIISTFEVTVRSELSKRVTGRFAALTGITSEDMLAGIPLDEAVDRYNSWSCGDTVTMTWSNSDLFSILENEQNLLSGGRRFNIGKYLDLQKYIQGEMRLDGLEITNQIALSNAAEMLNISVDSFDLHTAKDDSLVCVAMLKSRYNEERLFSMIRDTSDPEFYRRLTFKPFSISDLNYKGLDTSKLAFMCDVCGAKAKRVGKWKYRNRWFSADFKCRECGREFSGRVSFRQTYDGIAARRKICEKTVAKVDNIEVQPLPENVRV